MPTLSQTITLMWQYVAKGPASVNALPLQSPPLHCRAHHTVAWIDVLCALVVTQLWRICLYFLAEQSGCGIWIWNQPWVSFIICGANEMHCYCILVNNLPQDRGQRGNNHAKNVVKSIWRNARLGLETTYPSNGGIFCKYGPHRVYSWFRLHAPWWMRDVLCGFTTCRGFWECKQRILQWMLPHPLLNPCAESRLLIDSDAFFAAINLTDLTHWLRWRSNRLSSNVVSVFLSRWRRNALQSICSHHLTHRVSTMPMTPLPRSDRSFLGFGQGGTILDHQILFFVVSIETRMLFWGF